MTHPKPEPRQRRAPAPLKRTRIPRIGAGTHSQKVRKANELWRRLVYAKEPSGTCPRCKGRCWHDAAHFFAKGPYPSMRFELDNGVPVCRPCHRRIDFDHKAKLDFALAYLGPERYARLDLMSQARGKCDMDLTILFLRQTHDRFLKPDPPEMCEGTTVAPTVGS